MPNVIPVKLEYAVHELWFDPAGTGAQEGDHVIVQTERGHEIGLAVGDAQSMTNDELNLAIGHAALKNVLRICSDETSTAPRSSPAAARTPCRPSVAWSPPPSSR